MCVARPEAGGRWQEMKILFFNWRDIKNPAGGGAEEYIHEIAKRLVQKGHQVSFFTAAFPGCKATELIDGINFIRKGNRYTVYRQAKQYCRRYSEDFDTVIDSINTVPFMTPGFVKKDMRVIAIIYQLAREFWFYETPFPISWLGRYWLEPRWLKNYATIPTITISNSTRRDLLEIGYKYVEIVPVGLSIQPLQSVTEKESLPTLIFVGRMGRAKCPAHVLEAFSYIKKALPETRLWMVGDGVTREELQKRRIPDVTFFGYVENTKKYDLMSRAHLILVPGVREGWGLVVTEANARGTAAVGYDIHGLRDSIRDGKTGLLCEASPKCMAEKAVALLKDEDLRRQLSENALNWSKEFNWDYSADEFLKVLSKNT